MKATLELNLPSLMALTRFCRRAGISPEDALSRAVTWMVQQDDVVQWALLSDEGAEAVPLAEVLLKRLAHAAAVGSHRSKRPRRRAVGTPR